MLRQIGERVRAAAGRRSAIVVVENEPQQARVLRPAAQGGYGLDAAWNDDFHHSAVVALTGRSQAYFSDHRGSPQELLSAMKHGFLFQGQRYDWQKKRRGQSTRGLPPRAFVTFLENHDQTANYGLGERLWARCSPGAYRAMTALLLLGPWTPMLFQGQEWLTTSPFCYFVDHGNELGNQVKKGRGEFLAQFPRYEGIMEQGRLPDPTSRTCFEGCRLDWGEVEKPLHARALLLHQHLLALRRSDPTLSRQGSSGVSLDGTAIDAQRMLIRFFGEAGPGQKPGSADRLFLFNLGADHEPRSISEPLAAPPEGMRWVLKWSSEDPRYGGQGVRGPRTDHDIFFAGQAAELFEPEADVEAEPPQEAKA
jgi:maltooligosyltrehalose trehalohydrolase